MNLSSTQTTVGAATRFGVGCYFMFPRLNARPWNMLPKRVKSRHQADEGPLVELRLAYFVLKLC